MGAMEKSFQFPMALVVAGSETYAPDVVWRAPRRGIVWRGRNQVVAYLLIESAAMQALQLTLLRRSVACNRVIDEFSARFFYSGSGIDGVDLPQGGEIELKRLRILDLANDLITGETCIETWTVLRAGACGTVSTNS
jgi:hypothetical protein